LHFDWSELAQLIRQQATFKIHVVVRRDMNTVNNGPEFVKVHSLF
jgi:hypothetical protein